MHIKETKLPKNTDGTPNTPDPVIVTLAVPIVYLGGTGKLDFDVDPFVVSRPFAMGVLAPLENHVLALNQDLAIGHLGIYNPRPARGKNGKDLVPFRWSNHTYRAAIDFVGLVDKHGSVTTFVNIVGFNSLLLIVRKEIINLGRKPEIVNEKKWYHLGMFPEKETKV